MAARSFLDTNVFAYSFDETSPQKRKRSIQLIGDSIASRTAIVSFQVVQEFFNVACRRFKHPMTEPEAQQYLSTVFKPLLAIHSSPALYGDALRIFSRYRLSWYDSLIVAAAREGGCSTLYSEDLQDGLAVGETTVKNPFAGMAA